MQNNVLHIIEPTLFDQTGHGFSYVQSILQANSNFGLKMHVWLDQRCKDLFPASLCTTHNYFVRAWRQVQKVWLYFKLLRQPGIIFVSTSDLWDLKLLAWFSKCSSSKARVCLHFHQFTQKPKKMAALRKIAAAAHNITILTPTEKLTAIFQAQGFKNCHVVPCPTFTPTRTAENATGNFAKVLYAGAARSDKGFPTVIKLLQALRAQNITTPFEIQISTPNSQRYDAATTLALQELENIPRENLLLHKQTLAQSEYQALFNNAVSLLLYDQKNYQDKFSGIALDAFYAGCPIITVCDTWMGDMAKKYQAGIALPNLDVATIQQALEQIINNYAMYHANAKHAAQELQRLHDPKNTLQCILQCE